MLCIMASGSLIVHCGRNEDDLIVVFQSAGKQYVDEEQEKQRQVEMMMRLVRPGLVQSTEFLSFFD